MSEYTCCDCGKTFAGEPFCIVVGDDGVDVGALCGSCTFKSMLALALKTSREEEISLEGLVGGIREPC